MGRVRGAWCGALLTVGVGLAAGGAVAQESDEPVRLIPRESEAGAPPDAPKPAEASPKPVTATAKPGDSVEVGELEAIGPDSLGLAEAAGAPLPRTLWQRSQRPFVEALIARLPHGPTSPAMRALAIRLLASPGAPPEGPEGGATAGSFLSARAAALAAMGEYQVAGALLREGAASGLADPMRPRIESDVYFLAGGDYGRACTHVRAEVQRGGDSYWQKALVFCQIVAGETEAASLGLDLLRESDAGDTAYLALADSLLGAKTKLDKLPDPTPLHFAMLRQAKKPVPESAIAGANPALLRLVAESSDSPMKVRLAAVEAAEAAGTVPAESVGRFYAAVEFKKDQLADPVAAAEKLAGPLARALLYRAAQAELVPEARAKLLQAVFARARQDGLFPTLARVSFPLVSKLDATPALIWFAGDAARALLAAAEPAAAGRWYQVAAGLGASNPDGLATANGLWPIMTLATATPMPVFDAARFEDWLEANGGTARPETGARANLVLSLLQATGAKVPPAVWRSLALGAMTEQASVATPATLFALDDATAGKRLGETAALSLVALGDAGPSGAATTTLGRVVAGLVAVGLDEPARALALEAALGKGL